VVTWPRLAAMAKKRQLPGEIRKQAIFWLGQEAADEAVGPLEESTDDPESEIRKAAVFALSQQHTDHSIDVLVRVARTHRDKETRRQAFFWLGQSEDPRGIALFEEVLAGR
jgi:HEAT repeat protein